jgi:trehalose 6-phosphate synthase/phosphatase
MAQKSPKPLMLETEAVTESPLSDAGRERGSYFTGRRPRFEPESPTKVAKGARSSADLLRKLSLVDTPRPSLLDLDPRNIYPSLELSGRIISATICIPHSLGFCETGGWVSAVESQIASKADQYIGDWDTPWNLGVV